MLKIGHSVWVAPAVLGSDTVEPSIMQQTNHLDPKGMIYIYIKIWHIYILKISCPTLGGTKSGFLNIEGDMSPPSPPKPTPMHVVLQEIEK